MSPRTCTFSVAIAAFACGGGLAAQSEPASDRQIVVTGEREPPTEQEIGNQARNISIIGSPLDNPLPRFEDRVCPGVLGLEDEAAGFINERIRHNAAQFDIRLAANDGKCEPNFIVAFVADAQGQMAQLARSQGYILAGLSVNVRGELLDAPGAARVWANTVTRTSTGMPVPNSRDASSAPEKTISYIGESPIRVTLPPVATGSTTTSRISFPTREDIYSVLILFDREQVRGKSLLQLADYATMRGLAFTRETRGEVPADTILSLFVGDGPKPDRLTAFDLGYLGSLYDGIPNIPAASKLANVDRHMERQQAAAAVQE